MILHQTLNKGILLLLAITLIFAGCSKDASLTETTDQLPDEELAFRGSNFNFTASLKGRNEVPAVETNAAGNTIVKIAKDESSIYFKLIVANIENVRFAHFHMAPEGQNGPVVAFLYPGPTLSNPNGILAEGVITAADVVGPLAGNLDLLIHRIRNGLIYVNVHTDANPGGELRGQL